MRKAARVPRPRLAKPTSAEHAALGRAIEALLRERAMKPEDLAAATSMDIKQLGSYLRGQGNPTYATILRISRGLGVAAGTLVAMADELDAQR
jgi:transcriptional regulator with XRE-family HTH domain